MAGTTALTALKRQSLVVGMVQLANVFVKYCLNYHCSRAGQRAADIRIRAALLLKGTYNICG
ncbi:MAG: hypothetical protein EXS36_01290 [Pedosphaera sp.]|nr:hypothetical protein [Pedosphaera sp.]